MAIKPDTLPKLSESYVGSVLRDHNVTDQVALLGVRGYFLNTMGAKGKNDYGLYDDALFLISPSAFLACNANTDPSDTHENVATLELGLWRYKVGTHGLSKPVEQRYTALVQASEVEVQRYGHENERGFFGINIHKGGYTKTGSEGCVTLFPDQWFGFISLVQAQLILYKQKTIPFLLIENDGTL